MKKMLKSTKLTILTCILFSLLLINCTNKHDTKVNLTIEDLEKRIDLLSTDLEGLRSDLLLGEYTPYLSGTFGPSSKGFQRIDTTAGIFLVALIDVKQYADGYKLTFNIGNPNTANYSSMKANISWGKKFDYKSMNYSEWEKSLKHKEDTILQTIYNGYWNKVDLIISPARAEELGNIKLTLQTEIAELRQSRSR